MPTISGQIKLPGAETPLTGTWWARIHSDVNATIDGDGTIRAGIEPATDVGEGAEMTLPAGLYDFMFVSDAKNPATKRTDTFGWYTFEVTAAATWGDVMTTPVVIPVTPQDVTLAEEAREAAEEAAAAAEVARDEAVAAKEAAEQVPVTNDAITEALINQQGSKTQVALSAAFVPGKKLRLRDIPGPIGVPKVMATPPTVAQGTYDYSGGKPNGSAITGALWIRATDPALTYSGCIPQKDPWVIPSVSAAGMFSRSSTPPFAVDFLWDTVLGAFDVLAKDSSGNACRVLVDGELVTLGATFKNPGSSGSALRYATSGLTAGVHHIRLEFGPGAVFTGIEVGPTDRVSAIKPFRSELRVVVVGDSITEPTVQDTAPDNHQQGFAQHLSHLLGCEVISVGSGGTGYLNPGQAGAGRFKFRDRIADDVLPLLRSGDIVIWAGALNDWANYSAAAIGAEASACFAQVAAARPYVQQIVLSQFAPRGHVTWQNNWLATADALAAAAAVAGLPFFDLLRLPIQTQAQPAGTMTAASTAGATTISSTVPFRVGTLVQVGSGTTSEVRTVQSVTGSGPYTIGVQEAGNPLYQPHTAGSPVAEVGPAHVTAWGRQGNPAGVGTGDRYTGNDSTHPTMAGHRAIGEFILWLLQRWLAAQIV